MTSSDKVNVTEHEVPAFCVLMPHPLLFGPLPLSYSILSSYIYIEVQKGVKEEQTSIISIMMCQ